jgi:hypothetical protein
MMAYYGSVTLRSLPRPIKVLIAAVKVSRVCSFEEGYEPVRQIAIDDDWSALRFRKPEKIKKMVRDFAVTDEGIKRTKKE